MIVLLGSGRFLFFSFFFFFSFSFSFFFFTFGKCRGALAYFSLLLLLLFFLIDCLFLLMIRVSQSGRVSISLCNQVGLKPGQHHDHLLLSLPP